MTTAHENRIFDGRVLAVLPVVYAFCVYLGIYGTFPTDAFWIIWPANGVLFAVLAVLPRHRWPWCLFIAWLIDFGIMATVTELPMRYLLTVTVLDILEPACGLLLLQLIVGGNFRLRSPGDVGLFLAVTVFGITAIGSFLGAGAIHFLLQQPFFPNWQIWWFSYSLGYILVGGLTLMLLTERDLLKFRLLGTGREYAGLMLMIAVGSIAFLTPDFQIGSGNLPVQLQMLIFLLIIWIALRFAVHQTAIASTLIAGIGLFAVWKGTGPFHALYADNYLALVSTQYFVAIVAVTGYTLSSHTMRSQSLATDLRARQRDLRQREQQLRDVTDSVPAAIAHIGADQRYIFINKKAEQWLSTSDASLVGGHVRNVYSKKGYAEVLPYIEAVLAGETIKFQTSYTFADGVERQVAVTYAPEWDADDKVVGYFSLAMDVSEQHTLEERLRQAQKMEAVGQLTGGIAHDFNNLLAIIMGNLELLLATNLDDQRSKMAKNALEATERGANLTHDLLAFSRAQPLQPAVIDIDELLGRMQNLLKHSLRENIEIKLVGGADRLCCEVDPGQLENAILNLSINASDAMPNGGKLTIATSSVRMDGSSSLEFEEVEPGQYIQLAVSDTGIGMTPEVVSKAFDPFFTTKDVGEGSGLGLSMIYGFARQSGGHTTIYSEPGKGTTVRIYLPQSNADNVAAYDDTLVSGFSIDSQGEVIMVVEDDAEVLEVVVVMLSEMGYEVLTAAAANDALRQINGNDKIDLLLSDVVLAGDMGGQDLVAHALRIRPDLKIMYMSGYSGEAIAHHGRLDSDVALLTKPFRRTDLGRKLREILDN